MQRYNRVYQPLMTPQSQPVAGQAMVQNDAGGFVYPVNKWTQLDRFLVIGTENGTYYSNEHKLVGDNAKAAVACIKEDGLRVVQRVVDISDSGRAPRNDPALFVLALAASEGDAATKAAALAAIPKVARTGTHLFHYLEYVQTYRGWGRGLRRAVADWYINRAPMKLAQQLVKYRQRDGWSHQDAIRLAHPHPQTPDQEYLLHYAAKGGLGDKAGVTDAIVQYMEAVEEIQGATEARAIQLIREQQLPREVVPTNMLNSAAVWDALLDKMPMTAMIRNLATMTRVGLLVPGADATNKVVATLGEQDQLRQARVHPMQLLIALKTYASGGGVRSARTHTPVQKIVDALDGAFYVAFGNVVPTNKKILLGVDWSGSMGAPEVLPGITPATGAAAMALITAATETNCDIVTFATSIKPVSVSPGMRLDQVCRITAQGTGEGTDCSVPMRYAMSHNLKPEAFVIYTDSQSWYGNQHPIEALWQYRRQTGIAAKLVCVNMVANEFSLISDAGNGKDDALTMNTAGFDAAVPQLISDFVAG